MLISETFVVYNIMVETIIWHIIFFHIFIKHNMWENNNSLILLISHVMLDLLV